MLLRHRNHPLLLHRLERKARVNLLHPRQSLQYLPCKLAERFQVPRQNLQQEVIAPGDVVTGNDLGNLHQPLLEGPGHFLGVRVHHDADKSSDAKTEGLG
ncbi:hypothetical protein D3C81_1268420 [compost metagenome]